MSEHRKAPNNGPKICKEKEVVAKMIHLYCRKKHHRNYELCEECNNLLKYATERLSRCPFGEVKSACSNCTIHCYEPSHRQSIKSVMRFAGPRMLLYHPVYSVKHMLNK